MRKPTPKDIDAFLETAGNRPRHCRACLHKAIPVVNEVLCRSLEKSITSVTITAIYKYMDEKIAPGFKKAVGYDGFRRHVREHEPAWQQIVELRK